MRANRAEPQPTRSNGSVCPHHLFPSMEAPKFLFTPRGWQGTLPRNVRLASQSRHEKCILGYHEDSSDPNRPGE